MKILIAEDDKISARILERSLTLLGYEPVVESDGTSAWETLQTEHFPVLITDWMMPGIEGPELCRKVRSLPTEKYTYIVMLTARGEKSDRNEAMESGADDFLSKPLDRQELEARLAVAERILSMQHRLEKQNEFLKSQQADLENARIFSERVTIKAETASNRFSQLFDGQPLAGFTFDDGLIVRELNFKATKLFDKQIHELMDVSVFDLLGKQLASRKARNAIRGVMRGRDFEKLELSDGKRYFHLSGHKLTHTNGTVYGGICNLIDVTKQRLAEIQLSTWSMTDVLTKIANHRAFQDRLSLLLAEGKRGRRFCLVISDVDFFKRFNDDFGHQAGDEVLIAVASTLQGSIRDVDFVARYGGEEFCALLTDVDTKTAMQLVERVRVAIESIKTPYRQITASFGVAEYGRDLNTAKSLIKAADTALYMAKESGRNRACFASMPAESKAA